MSGSCSTTDVVYRQRILQEQDRNRIAHALLMQRAMSTMELRDTRPPPKEEEPMFPTPGSSPSYTTHESAACYPDPTAAADINCQYHSPRGLNEMEMPAPPVDDSYYHRQSPYSSGYEDNSSPLSIACSPHSTISNGSISYEFMAPPHSDTLTTMASTAPGVPPLPPPPTCITTLPLTTSTFQAGIESQKCIYTTAPPVYYPPITQVDAWPPQPPPPSLTRFSEPTGFVPPHSSAVMGTSVAEGEVPINVIEQAFPDSDSIIYYPLTPESPEDKHNTFQCADYAPPPSDIYPTGVAAMPMCTPYMPHVLSKQQTATNLKPPKRKTRVVKPAVQVDDSDIKDIPTSAQLWEFTLRVLKKPKYHYMVNWENRKEGLFRFHDAQAFATLWGKHRNRPNMTYDKVARALRYYYKRDILNQVGGRLTYRFSRRLSKLYLAED